MARARWRISFITRTSARGKHHRGLLQLAGLLRRTAEDLVGAADARTHDRVLGAASEATSVTPSTAVSGPRLTHAFSGSKQAQRRLRPGTSALLSGRTAVFGRGQESYLDARRLLLS